jgi:hypothetical protein
MDTAMLIVGLVIGAPVGFVAGAFLTAAALGRRDIEQAMERHCQRGDE